MYTKHGEDVENGKQLVDDDTDFATADNTPRRRRSSVRKLLRRVAAMTAGLAILAAFGAVVCYFLDWIFLVELILVAIVAYLAAGNWRWFYVVFKTAPRDLR